VARHKGAVGSRRFAGHDLAGGVVKALQGGRKVRPFLVVAIVCLALFLVAGIVIGELIPSLWPSPRSFRPRRVQNSMWPLLQNISAVVGIASFLIQIVQWRRKR
jgi:hypothetical protein